VTLVRIEPGNVLFDREQRNTVPAKNYPAQGCDPFCSVDRTGVTAVSHVLQVSLV